ncbi:unnamed protein product [Euphydryas editha]|uniref:Helix-turn-helix domain-containing protein n=1 Tax=Euphydryas editha TaxID=104508 RepID=A0AAU9TQP2_EUPED|nr:unnamed protein product [Euphydryas editha]
MINCEPQETMNVEVLESMANEIFEEWMFNRPFDGIFGEIFNTSSDSDSSEENPQFRNKRVCIKYFIEDVVHSYRNKEFQSHFRLSRSTVYNLIERFQQKGSFDCNDRIEEFKYERTFLVILWYLANLETLRQIADRFDISKSSAHNNSDYFKFYTIIM